MSSAANIGCAIVCTGETAYLFAWHRRLPDSVILDGPKDANKSIQQKANEANREPNAAHHDPSIPNPTAEDLGQ